MSKFFDQVIYRPDLIVSAFQNEMNDWKVQAYTEEMSIHMEAHEFPNIKGFWTQVTAEDIEKQLTAISGYEFKPQDKGMTIWKVTDGHHRSTAAVNAGLGWLTGDIDRATIVTEEELLEYELELKNLSTFQ